MAGININQIKKDIDSPKSKKKGESKISNILTYDISFKKKEFGDKKKANFYNDLFILLSSGIDLRSTLDLMCEEAEKKENQIIYKSIRDSVISGSSLSEALEATDRFSIYETYSVRIGEETGCLNEILKDLVGYFQKRIEQKRKIKSAFSYPVFVFGAAIIAVFFMMAFVVPMFQDVFSRFGNDLPIMTKTIIDISDFISENLVYILISITLLIIAIWILRKNEKFKQIQSLWILHIPFFGELCRKMYLARFCLAMALLTEAHIPLLHALSLIKKMISFYPLQQSIEFMEEGIMHGKPLHQCMTEFSIYDKRMISLIKVGEEVNQLNMVFNRLKTQYMDDVDYQTGMIGNILEPLMIIFIGIFVGIILVAMYLPIFKLSTSIGF